MEETRDGFVLDCSVTMAWGFDDEATPYTNGVRDRLADGRRSFPLSGPLRSPTPPSSANAANGSTKPAARGFSSLLSSLPIIVDDETAARAWADTMHLARAHNLSAYDATYLELAIRLGLPLACLDGKLKMAAAAVGVPLYEVA